MRRRTSSSPERHQGRDEEEAERVRATSEHGANWEDRAAAAAAAAAAKRRAAEDAAARWKKVSMHLIFFFPHSVGFPCVVCDTSGSGV
jgi:hypothetical protein